MTPMTTIQNGERVSMVVWRLYRIRALLPTLMIQEATKFDHKREFLMTKRLIANYDTIIDAISKETGVTHLNVEKSIEAMFIMDHKFCTMTKGYAAVCRNNPFIQKLKDEVMDMWKLINPDLTLLYSTGLKQIVMDLVYEAIPDYIHELTDYDVFTMKHHSQINVKEVMEYIHYRSGYHVIIEELEEIKA